MEKLEIALVAFVSSALVELGYDVTSHIPDDVKEKYEKILDNEYSDFNTDESFQTYLLEVLDGLIEKIKEHEGVSNE